MRRSVLATLFLLAVLLAEAPLGSAAARIDVIDANIYTLDHQLLSHPKKDQTVTFTWIAKNIGDANQDGTVSFTLHIRSKDGGYDLNKTLDLQMQLGRGNTTEVSYDWTATQAGEYSAQFYVGGQLASFSSLEFTVSPSASTLSLTMGQRVLDYGWVFVAFLAVVVLFVAVVRSRH